MLKSILLGVVTFASTIGTTVALESANQATEEAQKSFRTPLSSRTSKYNKYMDMRDRSINILPQKSYAKKLSEWVWGKDQQTLNFERGLANYKDWKAHEAAKTKMHSKKHRLGAAEIQTELTQIEGGQMFHGPLYFGSSQKYFDVIYDTGSDWVVVDGITCQNCEGNKYDPLTSTQSENLGNDISLRAYGTALLAGTEYTDLVCINEYNGCVKDFAYFLITKNQTGLNEPFDGLMGLARNRQPMLGDPSNMMEIGPIFPDYLANVGETSDSRFSFSLGYETGDLFVDFGIPQNDAMSSQEDIVYIPMEKDFYWSAFQQGIGFGDISDPNNTFTFEGPEGKGGSVYSILDTGSSAVMLTQDYWQTIVVKLFEEYIGTKDYAIE